MGAAAYGGKGFKGRARISGERPIGAASCRQQHNQVSFRPPPPPLSTLGHHHWWVSPPPLGGGGFHSHSFLKLCAFEWLQSSSCW